MKHFILTVSTAVFLTFSGGATAEDANILVFDSNIIQIQEGSNLTQKAMIATVSSEFKGKVSIVVNGSNIVQVQSGNNNTQSARIATVGCNCDGS